VKNRKTKNKGAGAIGQPASFKNSFTMTNYEQWQQETYGNIITDNCQDETENGSEAREINDSKVEQEALINLIEQQF